MSKVVQKDQLGDVTLFCMSKDTEISTHTSTRCGYVYVLEGDGIFTLVKEEIQMKPQVLISMAANAKHSIIAKENTSFLLILKSVSEKPSD